MIPNFHIVVAMDLDRGIGKNGGLPWKLSGDLKNFRELTTRVATPDRKNAVIMGRKTWESIPEKRRPLPDRINVVLTRRDDYVVPSAVVKASSLEEALEKLQALPVERCFVIGGGEIFGLAVDDERCDCIYQTEVGSRFECDTFFPGFEARFTLVSAPVLNCEGELAYTFNTYRRKSRDAGP